VVLPFLLHLSGRLTGPALSWGAVGDPAPQTAAKPTNKRPRAAQTTGG